MRRFFVFLLFGLKNNYYLTLQDYLITVTENLLILEFKKCSSDSQKLFIRVITRQSHILKFERRLRETIFSAIAENYKLWNLRLLGLTASRKLFTCYHEKITHFAICKTISQPIGLALSRAY